MCRGMILSSLILKQLKEVDQLMLAGKHSDALNFIDKIAEEELTEKDKTTCLLYRLTSLNASRNSNEALNIAKTSLKQFKNQKPSIVEIEILNQKGIALSYLSKGKKEREKIIKELESKLAAIDDISRKDKDKMKANVFRLKLFITFARVEPKEYLKLAQNCNKHAEKSGDKRLINFSRIFLALAYYRNNEKEKSLELIKNAYEHAMSIGFKQGQEDSLWSLSYYETNRERSLELAEKAIALHEEFESNLDSYGRYVLLGCRYVLACEFEKALLILRKAEEALEVDNKEKYSIYFVYARLFNLKGEFNLAYENTLQAKKLAEEINRKPLVANSNYELVLLALELDKLELAKKHLEELRSNKEDLDDDETNQMYKLASALILKASKGFREWTKATAILEELLENEALSTSIFITTTLNLCELLIREIELIGETNILTNIQNHLSQLQELAEDRKIYWLLIEILRLKSQIALLVFDIQKARELLEAALRISQEKRIGKLTVEIINEQIEIEEKISIWEKLQKLDAPLIETLKHVHLLNNIVEINQKTATVKSCGGDKNVIEYRKLFSLKI